MSDNRLNNKVTVAARWSVTTEIAARLVMPVSTMILARLLSPEAFGVVATVTMIVSFVEMFADAGFQKYLVQHEFRDDRHRVESTNVSFWTNLTMALIIWAVIVTLRESIAIIVGTPGLGLVIAVACIQLPITAFSSIQMALYRRDFDFRTLFITRIIAIFVPFVVTIPLALLGWGYWSLIIGTICGAFTNAFILTFKSRWKPQLFYSFSLLREMITFSVWSLIEAISIWLTGWVDIFIIGSTLNSYYLGLYRTSLTMVSGVFGIIISSTTPVLFSALSRLQNENFAFQVMFFKVQKIVAYFVLPMGLGIYLYSNDATQILLGNQWWEASKIIGIWALALAPKIVFGNFSSEVYRARGKPLLSFLAQILHLAVLIPTCIISLKYGFWSLVYARSIVLFQFILVHLIIMKYVIKFPIWKMFTNMAKPTLFVLMMGVIAIGLQQVLHGLVWNLFSIWLCIAFYFGLMWFFVRSDVKLITKLLLKVR